jgi:hypothetical protein
MPPSTGSRVNSSGRALRAMCLALSVTTGDMMAVKQVEARK